MRGRLRDSRQDRQNLWQGLHAFFGNVPERQKGVKQQVLTLIVT
jgi:hypothetical protein